MSVISTCAAPALTHLGQQDANGPRAQHGDLLSAHIPSAPAPHVTVTAGGSIIAPSLYVIVSGKGVTLYAHHGKIFTGMAVLSWYPITRSSSHRLYLPILRARLAAAVGLRFDDYLRLTA